DRSLMDHEQIHEEEGHGILSTMKNYFTKLNTIAIYQITGGIFGAINSLESLTLLLRNLTLSFPYFVSIFINLLFLLITILLAISGFLILRNKFTGLRISRVLQLIQIPIISSRYFLFATGLPVLFQ